MNQLIAQERFTSIQKAQAGLTKLLQEAEEDFSFHRVLRNNKPVGVLMPNRTWESFLEDLEALSSPRFLRRIAVARRSKRKISLIQIKREFGVRHD